MPSHDTHNTCDWENQKAMVFSKIEDIQEEIKSQSEDIKCLNRKVSDLKADQKANGVVLIEIQKNVDEIKQEIREQSTRNNSKLSNINIDLGKMQTRFAIYAGIASFIVAVAVSISLKLIF